MAIPLPECFLQCAIHSLACDVKIHLIAATPRFVPIHGEALIE